MEFGRKMATRRPVSKPPTAGFSDQMNRPPYTSIRPFFMFFFIIIFLIIGLITSAAGCRFLLKYYRQVTTDLSDPTERTRNTPNGFFTGNDAVDFSISTT